MWTNIFYSFFFWRPPLCSKNVFFRSEIWTSKTNWRIFLSQSSKMILFLRLNSSSRKIDLVKILLLKTRKCRNLGVSPTSLQTTETLSEWVLLTQLSSRNSWNSAHGLQLSYSLKWLLSAIKEQIDFFKVFKKQTEKQIIFYAKFWEICQLKYFEQN